jgi:hypothetical protein
VVLVTLMMEALRSSETLDFTRTAPRNIPEDGIYHSHCHENLKSYMPNEDIYNLKDMLNNMRMMKSKRMR